MKSLFYCLFAFVFLSLSAFSALAQDYEVRQIDVTPYSQSIKRGGKVDFKRTLRLSFKSSGYLKQLSVDEGDTFEKNQILASLDTFELKEAKNSRYAELLQAKSNVKRLAELIKNDMSSEFDLEQAETRLETTRAAYKVAFYNLEKAQIIAPFKGVVLSRTSELDELQSPNREVLEIAAIDNNLVIKVGLTDKEIGFVKLGQQVSVFLPSLGQLSGKISKIPVQSNTNNQLYLIDVLLEGIIAGQGVVTGQLAQVNITFDSDKFVYQVPLSALVKMHSNGDAVLLIQNEDVSGLIQQSFNVVNVDSNFLYLRAQSHNTEIAFVIHGWQQYSTTGH